MGHEKNFVFLVIIIRNIKVTKLPYCDKIQNLELFARNKCFFKKFYTATAKNRNIRWTPSRTWSSSVVWTRVEGARTLKKKPPV